MNDLFITEDEQAATGALFSPCRRYRYLLWRIWDFSKPHATFCLMNGSTADEVADDATVTRCTKERADAARKKIIRYVQRTTGRKAEW